MAEIEKSKLKAIHIILEAEDGTETKLTFEAEGTFSLISQVAALSGARITERSVDTLLEQATGGEGKEKLPPVTLTGRLKTRPKPGRPDGRGNPTAWAMLAVHEEGSPTARMLSTTFHRHTAAIATRLPQDAVVTADGYLKKNPDPTKSDSYSVFRLINYPGKKRSEAHAADPTLNDRPS